MLFIAAALMASASLNAILTLPQDPSVGFEEGDSVVVVVPSRYEWMSHTGLGGMNTKLDIKSRITDGVIEVRDPDDSTWHRDWRAGGFPSAVHYYVSRMKTVTRVDAGDSVESHYIELTLKHQLITDRRVFVPSDQPEALKSLVAPIGAADSVMKVAYDSLGARFFTGTLTGFSPDERNLLLRFAHITANGTRIASENFKSINYLVVALPPDAHTWNNLRVTRTERIGRLIGDQLALLKAFARVTVRHDLIGGLKLTVLSMHGNAPDYSDLEGDKVEAYFPIDALMKFADADITSQRLLDQSIILVKGDRIEVDLRTQ